MGALWPAPYLLAGSVLSGVAIVWMIQTKLHPEHDWNPTVGLLEAAFFSVWIVRDVLYLQWMNLRRGRRPIFMAIMYMVVFYTCASTLFVPLQWYTDSKAPYASIFIPLNANRLNALHWVDQRGAWILALSLLCVEAMAFAALQWRALQKLRATSQA